MVTPYGNRLSIMREIKRVTEISTGQLVASGVSSVVKLAELDLAVDKRWSAVANEDLAEFKE